MANWKKKHFLASALEGISRTVAELERSVKTSQSLEQRQFHNELQLLIDKHELSLNLERQQYVNDKLFESNLKECALLKGENLDEFERLKAILKDKNNRINAVERLLDKMGNDNVVLARACKEMSIKLRIVLEENEYLARKIGCKYKSMDEVRCDRNQCEHEIALRELQLHYAAYMAELISIQEENIFHRRFKVVGS